MTRSLSPVLMVQGTSSDAGKSFLVTALCRTFARRGLRVRPFKAQNMSNNAAVTAAGGEVGRAQALQARAAGVDVDERMNPVLLKPMADTRSEVVVMGRGDPVISALPWLERRRALWPVVRGALRELRAEADLVVAEGAGSPAEINLRPTDIVNMAVAREAGAAVVLVADIDRGGAFASLVGTWELLSAADRRHLRAFALNRFRGDATLLAGAPSEVASRTGMVAAGVIPYLDHALPAEDGASLRAKTSSRPLRASPSGTASSTAPPTGSGGPRIAVLRLPHLSNFDDVDPLASEPGVRISWVDAPAGVGEADAVILPGTRNVLRDLAWMRVRGLDRALHEAADQGAPIFGICGGLQLLGERIADPHGIEEGGEAAGLGLLPLATVLTPEKLTRRTRARVSGGPHPFSALSGEEVEGYEIHHGATDAEDGSVVSWMAQDGRTLGFGRGAVWGSYLHGIFAGDTFRRSWLEWVGSPEDPSPDTPTWESFLDAEIDRVADAVEAHLDVDLLLGLAREGVR